MRWTAGWNSWAFFFSFFFRLIFFSEFFVVVVSFSAVVLTAGGLKKVVRIGAKMAASSPVIGRRWQPSRCNGRRLCANGRPPLTLGGFQRPIKSSTASEIVEINNNEGEKKSYVRGISLMWLGIIRYDLIWFLM